MLLNLSLQIMPIVRTKSSPAIALHLPKSCTEAITRVYITNRHLEEGMQYKGQQK